MRLAPGRDQVCWKTLGTNNCLRLGDVTMSTQPYYDLFVKLAKWEIKIMEMIYFGDHGPSSPWLWQFHSTVLAVDNDY